MLPAACTAAKENVEDKLLAAKTTRNGTSAQNSAVLKLFEQVSTQLSAESYPTGSQVIVLSRGLSSVCAELLERSFNSVTRTIIEELKKGVKDCFHNVEMSKSIGVDTLLDLRFQTLVFANREAAENAKKQLVELNMNIVDLGGTPPAGDKSQFNTWDILTISSTSQSPAADIAQLKCEKLEV
ncbi:uncharacterized protein LOC126188717 [Schistocerca cancellata]|uniref:uncharacterized protein LOC126188717 n=1 Tax=Schistocerca cancellata TaxID=274614 RepID=UPI0021199275|nr:uncharacterized protein LOC126188717 [Schistocerca cancellata]